MLAVVWLSRLRLVEGQSSPCVCLSISEVFIHSRWRSITPCLRVMSLFWVPSCVIVITQDSASSTPGVLLPKQKAHACHGSPICLHFVMEKKPSFIPAVTINVLISDCESTMTLNLPVFIKEIWNRHTFLWIIGEEMNGFPSIWISVHIQ